MALEQVLAKVGVNPADFTAGELAAIEDDVANGGSVYNAIHKCAPTKSRSAAFTGGNYEWSRNSDGTFNIFDVPVFAKHVRKLGMKLVAGKDGEPKVEENAITVDEAWLNHAIEVNHQRLEHGKYMGALHVRHHPQPGSGEADKTEPAGRFVLKYVRPMMYDGAMVPVLYADFVKIPAPIFERIKAGLLPYRSIESLPPKFEEIDSIALLDTETPWFRLPMLTPGEEIQREVYAATCPPMGSPLRGVAWSASGKQTVGALCYFASGSFSEKKDEEPKEDDADEKEMQAEEGEGDDRGPGADGGKKSKSGTIQCEECGMTHPDDGRHDDEVGYAEMRAEGEGDETMGKILDALTILCKQNQELLNRMEGAPKPPAKAGDGAPVGEQGGKESSIQSKAADEGRVAALEQTVGDMKRKEEVGALVAKAMTDLVEFNLGTQAEQKLLAKALASKEPAAVINAYVDTVKEHGVKMPPRFERTTKEGQAPVIPPVGEIPESCRAYQAQGAEVLAKAIEARKQFLAAKELGAAGPLSEKDFIKYRVEPGYGAALKG